jgi:ATP-dependent DNA helicase RecG
MNKQELQLILSEGEGQYIEFKEKIDKNFSKELVGFANASGGTIYLGVPDDAEVKGFKLDNRIRSKIQDIARNCDPQIVVDIQEFENITIVNVKEGIDKPYSCSDGFFMRMGANAQKLKRDEILNFAIKSGKSRFDEQICENFDWNDFDDEKFEYYLKLAGISTIIERNDLLKNLNLLTDSGIRNAAVLLFSKKPYKYFFSSRIRCIHFRDNERVDILDKKEVDKGIIGNIEFAINYLKERVPVEYIIKSISRKELPEYLEDVYREAIINAVVHRDYYDFNADIAVEKLSDRIFINNPGGITFPDSEFGVMSYPRNRLIADVLSRTSYMEKAGTGIKRMRKNSIENNNILEIKYTDSYYFLSLFSNKKTQQKPQQKTRDKILILMQDDNRITTNEIAATLGISRNTINEHIANLKKEGLLERTGRRKEGSWKVIEK